MSWAKVRLSETQKRVLLALAATSTLRSHRYLNGAKVHKLHALDGSAETVRRATVKRLQRYGLITSNQKFPTATYTLTPKGKSLSSSLRGRQLSAVTTP